MGHFCALDSVCALVCVELHRDPAARVALPLESVELLVPRRRAPSSVRAAHPSLSRQPRPARWRWAGGHLYPFPGVLELQGEEWG